jgi:hypothetical protein
VQTLEGGGVEEEGFWMTSSCRIFLRMARSETVVEVFDDCFEDEAFQREEQFGVFDRFPSLSFSFISLHLIYYMLDLLENWVSFTSLYIYIYIYVFCRAECPSMCLAKLGAKVENNFVME